MELETNWDQMAKAYEEFTSKPNSYSMRIEWPAIKKILPNLEGKKVLDLGCGTGRFSFLFEEAGASKVVGVDLTEEMLAIARDKSREQDSVVEFIKGNIEELSDDVGNSYDFIFSSTTLHFLPQLDKVLNQIYDRLNSGGICILSVIHPVYSAQYPLITADKKFPEDNDWKVRYLNKEIRSYIQPWIEYNPDIKNFLTESYHHTMADYLNSMIKVGFSFEQLVEPMPPEDWKEAWPGGYYSYINTPTYAIFKLKK